MGVGQAPRGLHEKQFHTRHLGGYLVHIAAQDGRQIRIHHCGVTPANKLHHRAGAVRGAHLGEAHLTRQLGGRLFVCGVAVTVHEDHRHAAQAPRKCSLQLGAQMGKIQSLHHLTVGAHAFMRFDDLLVQQLGQHNVAVKQTRAVLVGNAQGIAKALCGDQQGGLAFALQQRIGGHRRAHLHAGHLVGRNDLTGLQAQQVANARHGRVFVVLGVVRQQLVGHQAGVGALGHDVRESAATVNPELPFVRGRCRLHARILTSAALCHGTHCVRYSQGLHLSHIPPRSFHAT